MEAGVGNNVPVPQGAHPCQGLLEVAPYFVKRMPLREMAGLRATCREGRAIADATISALAVDYVQLGATHGSGAPGIAVGVRQFAAFVRGILSRGAHVKALGLHPIVVGGPGTGQRRDAPENEDAALDVLSACSEHQVLSGQPAQRRPSLTQNFPAQRAVHHRPGLRHTLRRPPPVLPGDRIGPV